MQMRSLVLVGWAARYWEAVQFEMALHTRLVVVVGAMSWYCWLVQTAKDEHVLSVSSTALHTVEMYWVEEHAVHCRFRVAQLRILLVEESKSTKARPLTLTEPIMGMFVSEYVVVKVVTPEMSPCRSPRLPTEHVVPSAPLEHVPDTL
jgi:hypothetical protein